MLTAASGTERVPGLGKLSWAGQPGRHKAIHDMELGDRRMNSPWKPNSIPCLTAHGLAQLRRITFV